MGSDFIHVHVLVFITIYDHELFRLSPSDCIITSPSLAWARFCKCFCAKRQGWKVPTMWLRHRFMCGRDVSNPENEMAWNIRENIFLLSVQKLVFHTFQKAVSFSYLHFYIIRRKRSWHDECWRVCSKFSNTHVPGHGGRSPGSGHTRHRIWLHRFYFAIANPIADSSLPVRTRTKPKPGITNLWFLPDLSYLSYKFGHVFGTCGHTNYRVSHLAPGVVYHYFAHCIIQFKHGYAITHVHTNVCEINHVPFPNVAYWAWII